MLSERGKLVSLGWPAAVIFGVVGALLYCAFTFISFLFFPLPISPFERFLSELGMYSLNPNGAIFYNIGVILLGLGLMPFFYGVYVWFSRREQKKRLIVALSAGVFSAFSLLMTCVFYGDHAALHFAWAMSFFISFALAIVLFNSSLFYRLGIEKAISIFGYLVVVVNVFFLIQVLSGGSPIVAITEWFTVFAYLVWVGFVAMSTLRGALSVQGSTPQPG